MLNKNSNKFIVVLCDLHLLSYFEINYEKIIVIAYVINKLIKIRSERTLYKCTYTISEYI